jgi:hypothetical protein
MLKQLFGSGKPDHPLADPKEARRLLEELPGNDPLKALEELAHWHESVAGAEGFRTDERIQLHFLLDDAAQPRLRKIGREYLAAARPSRVQENRIWTHVYEYWRQCAIAHGRCVDAMSAGAKGAEAAKPLAAPLAARGLRAVAQQLKWLYLRYGPIDRALWQVLNGMYAFAEARGLAESKCTLYAPANLETSPRQEFLRAYLLNVASPDGLLPPEIDIAERLVAEWTPLFEFAPAASPAMSHRIDLAQAAQPQRIGKAPPAGSATRYFGAGRALAALQGHLQKIEGTRQLPAEIAAAGLADPESALDLLQHLLLYWSPNPPERRHPRHSVKSRLSIVHGFDGVVGALDTEASLDFDQQPVENWIVENVSAGGFGAVVPQAKGDWLKIGALLAMQPDGGNNWVVGMVRRVNKISSQEARVGIQTLSRAPVVTQLDIQGARQPGVLLPAALAGGGETSIVLRAGVFVPGQNLESERGGKSYVYLPQAVAERGEDYDIVKFREMIRET